MLASELKAIYTQQVKNQTFFNEQLLTDLSQIEHASTQSLP